ncbi:MAG: hypothetical protein WHV67_06455 [Thermoanaerobaculia bacterium]
MKKTLKFFPITAIPAILTLLFLSLHFKFLNFSFYFLKGTLKGFFGIVVLLFQL